MLGSRDNLKGSRENLKGSRDNLRGSRDNLLGSRDNVAGSRDNLREDTVEEDAKEETAGEKEKNVGSPKNADKKIATEETYNQVKMDLISFQYLTPLLFFRTTLSVRLLMIAFPIE